MFTIVDTPHKGRGVFAIQPLSKDTIILKEYPFLLAEDAYDAIYQMYGQLSIMDSDDIVSDDTAIDSIANIQAQFESLVPYKMDELIITYLEIEEHIATLPQYMEDFFRNMKPNRLRLLIAKFYRNAFRNQRDISAPPSAVLIQGALLNHSCANNIDFYVDRTGHFIFQTNRDIITGEELCNTYLDTILSIKKRQLQLRTQYGFICTCTKCSKK